MYDSHGLQLYDAVATMVCSTGRAVLDSKRFQQDFHFMFGNVLAAKDQVNVGK